MPQHVEMNRKRQLSTGTYDLDQPVDGVRRKGRPTLSGEDVAAIRVFLTKRRQHAELFTADRMNRRLAVLGPTNVQTGSTPKLDL
jgi:hypothetical protein